MHSYLTRYYDKAVWSLWLKMHTQDAAAHINRLARKVGTHAFDPDHRLSFYGDRTLLMLACWRGRLRCVRTLLEYGADVNARDAFDATPLLFASWAGRSNVVRWLLTTYATNGTSNCHIDLDVSGCPPMTSSCGGKGPLPAKMWAQRKGFVDIVRMIDRATVTVT